MRIRQSTSRVRGLTTEDRVRILGMVLAPITVHTRTTPVDRGQMVTGAAWHMCPSEQVRWSR